MKWNKLNYGLILQTCLILNNRPTDITEEKSINYDNTFTRLYGDLVRLPLSP